MANVTITPDQLGNAIAEELGLYRDEVEEELRKVTRKHITDLVRLTKATAPVEPNGSRKGTFKKAIAADYSGLKKGKLDIKATWYVKAPEHRLTHLLVHGHATRDGGRTRPDPFLANALDKVLPAFEADIEETLRK